jgi:hypothetical protein
VKEITEDPLNSSEDGHWDGPLPRRTLLFEDFQRGHDVYSECCEAMVNRLRLETWASGIRFLKKLKSQDPISNPMITGTLGFPNHHQSSMSLPFWDSRRGVIMS